MGVFFYQLVLPGQGRERAEQVMAGLDPELAKQCRLDPGGYFWADHDRGTSVILNDGAAPYGALPQAVSKALDNTVLLAYIYDDDFWGYDLYRKGDCLDMFQTVPDCLGEPDPRVLRHTPAQRAGLLAKYFALPPERVFPYLSFWTQEDTDGGEAVFACPGDEFCRGDCWQLADFLRRLDCWQDPPEQPPQPAAKQPEPAASKSGSDEAPPPAGSAPFRLREPVLFHPTDLSRCLPFLKAVRLLPTPRRRFFGLLPPKPVQMEERAPDTLDAAALERLLEDFFAKKTTQLELDMELPGKGVFVKRLKKMVSQPVHFTVELVQEGGRFLCLCLDDEDQYLYWLIADKQVYYNEDSEDHRMTTLTGRSVEQYLVHASPALMRQEVLLMLSNLDRKDEVFNCLGRMGVWSNEWHYRNKKKHQEMRERWCFSGSP